MPSKPQKTNSVVTDKKDIVTPLSLEEATALLKKLGEWEGVVKLDREIIINWATYLKNNKTTK